MIVFATFILIFVIPFFRKGLNAQQFWQFFWELASRLVVTVVFGFVLWGGVSLAVAAFDFLFGFDVDEEWYLRIWMMVVGVFGPWFYLAGFPREFASKEQVSFPRLLRILTMYIGTPIVGIYLIILYAYSLKILSTQQWPEGQVVWLMLAFLLIGFAVILFSYALQYTEKHPIYSRLQR